MTDPKKRPEEEPLRQSIQRPGRDDVHEQRDPAQPREGVVHPPKAEPRRAPPRTPRR